MHYPKEQVFRRNTKDLFFYAIVDDIGNVAFDPAKAPLYGFGRSQKQTFVMSFTIYFLPIVSINTYSPVTR